jgi:hypothetical protein
MTIAVVNAPAIITITMVFLHILNFVLSLDPSIRIIIRRPTSGPFFGMLDRCSVERGEPRISDLEFIAKRYLCWMGSSKLLDSQRRIAVLA